MTVIETLEESTILHVKDLKMHGLWLFTVYENGIINTYLAKPDGKTKYHVRTHRDTHDVALCYVQLAIALLKE